MDYVLFIDGLDKTIGGGFTVGHIVLVGTLAILANLAQDFFGSKEKANTLTRNLKEEMKLDLATVAVVLDWEWIIFNAVGVIFVLAVVAIALFFWR